MAEAFEPNDPVARQKGPGQHIAGSRIAGLGYALPAARLTSSELADRLGLDEAWILTRSGISERRLLGDHEPLVDLAVRAARSACADAGRATEDLDAVIVVSSTPEQALPATAALVSAALGADPCASFDLNASSAGFLYGLAVAEGLLAAGRQQRIVVLAAEALSRLVDWQDRDTCILFGDGAAAAVVEACPSDEAGGRLVDVLLGSDGSGAADLRSEPDAAGVPRVRMRGTRVFRAAVRHLASALEQLCARQQLTPAELQLVVAHQANARLLAALAERLQLAPERVPCSIASTGNVGAASLPLALTQLRDAGQLVAGAPLALASFGAGYGWGVALLRW